MLNPSARTRAEPHNFLSLKLLNKNSNAELLEIQKDRRLETVYRYCRDSQLLLAAVGISPGCCDSLGSLRHPARAAPEMGTPNAAPNARKRSKWENDGSRFLQNK